MPVHLFLCALLSLFFGAAQATEPVVQRLNFTVRVADRKVGEHVFEQVGSAAERRVLSRAHFTIEWLRIPIFRYRHEANEQWRAGCLTQIDATTHSNSRTETVRGRRTAGGFQLEAPSVTALEAPCVMTFAYWDRRILEQKTLLNAQTGAYMPIAVQFLGHDSVSVQGKAQPADHYLLEAQDLKIELWYGSDGQWLGLAAPLRDGRRMTYRLEG